MHLKYLSKFWITLAKLRQPVRMAIFTAVFIPYWVGYPYLIQTWGQAYRVLALVYIVLSSLLWGFRGALISTACGIAIGWFYHLVMGMEYLAKFIGPALGLVIAGFIGHLRDLSMQLDQQLREGLAAKKDLEEYKNSLEELVEKRTRDISLLATAIDQAAETIVVTDIDGNIIYANPSFQKTTGYQVKEALGQNPRLVKSGKHNKKFYSQLWDTITAGNVWTGKFLNRKKDGTLYREEATISPVKNSSGEIMNFVAVKRDVTREFNLEKSLFQARKMEAIGVLAGGIAHDFNNILSAIIGYTELTQMDVGKEGQTSNYLQEILKAGTRAKDLVQQILTFSRHTEQKLKPVSVDLIVKETLKLMRASLPVTIDIRQTIKSHAMVKGDPSQIHQIIMNLCTNAGQAMQEGGGTLAVELTTAEIEETEDYLSKDLVPGRYLQLSVGDTGHGIPSEIIDRIFDPFFTTKERGKGTGMGLAVVHGIVKSYGGTVTVDSDQGKGTVFKILLPVIKGNSETDPEKAQDSPPKGDEHILFIDDEPALVEIGEHILGSLGYQVVTSTSSVEALELFREQPDRFDLVITDMTMPGMTGKKMAKEMLAINKDIPIIICTGYSYNLSESKAGEMGIKGFLKKPVVLSEMARVVRKTLDEAKDPEVGGQKSEVRGQKSEVRSQRSEPQNYRKSEDKKVRT